MWRPICMDSVRLWRDRRYNGVEKGGYFPYFQRQLENLSLTTMQFHGTIRPRDGIFQPSRPSLPRDSFNTNVQKFATICRRKWILLPRVASQTFAASRRRNSTDLNSLLPLLPPPPPLPPILAGFWAKTFGAPSALSYYACNCAVSIPLPNNALVRTIAVRNIPLPRYLYRFQRSCYSFLPRLLFFISFPLQK